MGRTVDQEPMTRAAGLAARALGRTAPNPPVGAVVVRDGVVVGEGFHAAAGTPHAEVHALVAAGDAARGATVHVTLEPCCHHGRTPPCTDALIAAGVAEVRYALADPDPRVAGKGHAALAAAGIRVACEPNAAAAAVTAGYLHRVRTGRPRVTAKMAMTLDGRIATRTGDSRWISGEASRARVHALRDRMDAVVVGIGTALADDPLLTVRPAPPDGRQPLRVVVDSELRLPAGAALLRPAPGPAPIVAYCAPRVAAHPQGDARRTTLGRTGAELLALPPDTTGRASVADLLADLGGRGCSAVLLEGGGDLLAAFLAADLVDELQVCVAPVVVGGREAPGPVGGEGVARLADAGRWTTVAVERVGDDTWITARPAGRPVAAEEA